MQAAVITEAAASDKFVNWMYEYMVNCDSVFNGSDKLSTYFYR